MKSNNRHTIINLEKTKLILKSILPTVNYSIILAIILKVSNFGFPFYLDSTRIYNIEKIILDNDNVIEEQITNKHTDIVGKLVIYSKYKKITKDFSYRKVTTYDIKDMSKDELLKIYNNLGDNTIDSVFKKPISNKREYTLNKDIKDDREIIEVNFFDCSKNKYTKVKEPVVKNILISSLYVILTTIYGVTTFPYVYEGNTYLYMSMKNKNNK